MDYYRFNSVLSYGGVYNFICGARGLGKTYGAKRMAIKAFIRDGSQFIYVRRYVTELKSAKNTLFADIAHEFEGYAFRCHGDELQIKKPPHDGEESSWELMGYVVALSKAQQKKSVAYPRVKTIIYDEFIIDKGPIQYLPNEAKIFNDFYSTVDRYKDKTRVLFLANAVSVMNPYFIDYKIRPTSDDEFIIKNGGFIVAHFPKAENFTRQVFETRFGQFIENSEYAEYSVGNVFSDNTDALIKKKTPEATYYCTIETSEGIFSLWIDMSGPYYFAQEKRPKREIFWTMLPERMDENKILVNRTDKTLQYLRSAYGRGMMYFDTPQTRNAFAGVMKR